MTRWIKWGAIAALILVVAWTCYQWGQSVAREEAAEARTEAVEQARKEARRQMQEDIEAARDRARAHAERVDELQARVREQQQTVDEYAQSDQGQRECFGEKGVERFNDL